MIKQITKFYLGALFLCLTYGGFAQVSEGGAPYSFKTIIDGTVPSLQLPKLDMDKIRKEDETIGFTRDAVATQLGINLNNSGTWTSLPGGDRLWRVNLKAENAIFLILASTNFFIPEGGKLFIYNKTHTQVYGAYTSRSNNSLNSFTSPDIKSKEITLEYYEPSSIRGKSIIHIDRIYQGYEVIVPEITDNEKQYLYNKVKDFGDSQSCHDNAQCDDYDVWEEQRRSVARIRITSSSGAGFCSGALINNTAEDGIPYFLSAWHCQAGGTQIYSNWRFDFEYELPNCSNSTLEPTPVTVTGATELVKAQASDVLLLELSSLPAGNNYYLAGWNRANTPASSVFGFHHPAGDVKKGSRANSASFSNNSPVTLGGLSVPLTIPTGNLWGCFWDHGTIEGGSSGSPLFDNNQRIIGQLSGGSSSCTNPRGNNWYGKLSASWNLLDSYLDPRTSAVTVLNGFDGSITLAKNLRVKEINVNTSPCLFTTTTPVEVVIENRGTETQSNFDVEYEILKTSDNSTLTNQTTYMGSLATGQSDIITFEVDMSDKDEYIFTARTKLVDDELVGDDQQQENYVNVKPTVGANNVQITGSNGGAGFTVSWDRGDGESVIVLIKEGSDFTSTDLPVDGDSYSANALYGLGSPVGNAFVVYKGDAASVSVSNLDVATYYVAVVEFSCVPEDYLLEDIGSNFESFTNLENDLTNKINIYPNPASEYFTIDFNDIVVNQAQLHIYTISGQEVKTFSLEKGNKECEINIEDLRSGTYILQIDLENTSIRKKFVKE